MAHPEGQVLMDDEEAHAIEECYTAMEVTLQELQQQNQGLMCRLQEQQDMVAMERLCANRR